MQHIASVMNNHDGILPHHKKAARLAAHARAHGKHHSKWLSLETIRDFFEQGLLSESEFYKLLQEQRRLGNYGDNYY